MTINNKLKCITYFSDYYGLLNIKKAIFFIENKYVSQRETVNAVSVHISSLRYTINA